MADDGKPKGLTAKERLFVAAYIGESRFNGADAARRAGYAEANARFTARDLLTKPHIRAYVDGILATETASGTEILHELTDVAMAEWRDFVVVRTNPKTGETVEVRMDLRSKVDALELLGKARQLFTDNLNMSGGATVIVRQYREGNPKAREDEPDGGGL